jgi:hypothetical protein
MHRDYSDELLSRFLSNPSQAEALAWLKTDDGIFRNVGELDFQGGSNEESVALVQEIYKAGAKKVLAVEIDDYGKDGQNTGTLVVELPENPFLRKRVLDWDTDWQKSKGFSGESDCGQKYIFVKLD